MLADRVSTGFRFALFVAAISGTGCGSTPGGTSPVGVDARDATSDAVSGADHDSADAAPEAAADSLDLDTLPAETTPTFDAPTTDTTELDSAGESSADVVVTEATTPPSTWGCVENDKVCDCYDAHLTAPYTLPACATPFPCCVRFVVDNGKVPPYHGCDCYSDSYLTSLGKTCSEMIDRINGISIYTGAVATATCPSP